MSRGIGKIQTSVLERLRGCNGSVTLENLRWDLWEINRHECPTTQSLPHARDGISGSWNTSVARAVHKLAECDPKRIILTERKLISTDEFLLHYPSKTLSARTRFLRRQLLPILLDDSNPEFYSRYSRAGNESYYLDQRASRPAILSAAKMWQQSEADLVNLLPMAARDTQRVLFLLICKGKQLFLSEEVSAKGAFADYSEAVIQKGILSPTLSERLSAMRHLVLPELQEQHLNLKSKLYSLVDFGSRGSKSSLKPESVVWLDTRCHKLLKLLPGYEAPKETAEGNPTWLHLPRERLAKCPELDRLIDATALQTFRFLEIAA